MRGLPPSRLPSHFSGAAVLALAASSMFELFSKLAVRQSDFYPGEREVPDTCMVSRWVPW